MTRAFSMTNNCKALQIEISKIVFNDYKFSSIEKSKTCSSVKLMQNALKYSRWKFLMKDDYKLCSWNILLSKFIKYLQVDLLKSFTKTML
jgi:hypothetical protein